MSIRSQIKDLTSILESEIDPERKQKLTLAIKALNDAWFEWLQPGHQVGAMKLEDVAADILDTLSLPYDLMRRTSNKS